MELTNPRLVDADVLLLVLHLDFFINIEPMRLLNVLLVFLSDIFYKLWRADNLLLQTVIAHFSRTQTSAHGFRTLLRLRMLFAFDKLGYLLEVILMNPAILPVASQIC
jgi:hypothetical protein